MADMLASTDDLENLLRAGTIDTAAATLLIEMATAVVQAEVGQRIVRVTNDTLVLDLDEYDEGPYIQLPERPVVSVASVTIGSTPVTDYVLQASRARVWRALGWRSTLIYYTDQPSTTTVVYTHGYAPGDQKLQLGRATVLSMIAGLYNNPDGASSVKIDDYAATYAALERQLAASPNLAKLLKKQYGRPGGSARLITSTTYPVPPVTYRGPGQ